MSLSNLISRDVFKEVELGGKVPFRSVDTPVAKRPRDATAREPPRSTMLAIVPPWRMLRRFWVVVLELFGIDEWKV